MFRLCYHDFEFCDHLVRDFAFFFYVFTRFNLFCYKEVVFGCVLRHIIKIITHNLANLGTFLYYCNVMVINQSGKTTDFNNCN